MGIPVSSMHKLSPFPTPWTTHSPEKAQAPFMNLSDNRCPGQYQVRQLMAVFYTAVLVTTDEFSMVSEELNLEYKGAVQVLNPFQIH